MLERFFISSPIGGLAIDIKQEKLYSVSKSHQPSGNLADKGWSCVLSEPSQKLIGRQKLSSCAKDIQGQIINYFNKRLKKFDIPLFDRGTDFQKKAWAALREIPWGETATYGEVAGQLGIPKGARAVGGSCAKNPFLLAVPCHRVLSQKGAGGFALGRKAKIWLLSLEREI